MRGKLKPERHALFPDDDVTFMIMKHKTLILNTPPRTFPEAIGLPLRGRILWDDDDDDDKVIGRSGNSFDSGRVVTRL